MGNVSITISVPPDVVKFADRLASQRRTSRSSVITAMLTRQMQHELADEIAAAYQDWNAENEALAEAHRPLAAAQIERVEYDA